MDLLLPPVFQVDELDAQKNPVQQVFSRSRQVRGTLVGYTRERVSGHLFHPEDGSPEILILPAKTKTFEGTHWHVLAASFDPSAINNDLQKGRWLRHPLPAIAAGANDPLDAVIASWKNAFSYVAEDVEQGIQGFRPPQLGAIHAIHAHWAASSSTATIVMPTGTGKTDTMLGILVSAACGRVLVVVPTDPLRNQIAGKFLDLGILRRPGVDVLTTAAEYPVVCTLEHIPKTRGEVQELFRRAHVVVTTSAIVGQCTEPVQRAFPEVCPYLFIDEAHHAEAPTWSRFKGHFKDRRVVQFTATPFREDGKPFDGRIVFKYPLRKAQKEGYFKPIQFEPIVEFDRRRADQKIAERAIGRLRKELHLGHILMARVESVARAKAVFEFYKDQTDLNPIQLHTGIKSVRERDRAREQLIAKESRIVVCVDMLGEGFDLPELKIAAFHDIRKSLAVTLQLAGRFTRSRSDLGNARSSRMLPTSTCRRNFKSSIQEIPTGTSCFRP